MKKCLWFLSLLSIPTIFHGDWLYVDEGPWAYDLASGHWMYVLPFYHLSLDYDYRGQGQAEQIFDPDNNEFSDRWLYTGYLPYIYDFKAQTWTKYEWGRRRWACELVPDDLGANHSVWISAFDPLGRDMVPEELTIDTDLSLNHFFQAFSLWLISFDIYIRPIEQDGEILLFASPSTGNREAWADEIGWHDVTPAVYTKTSETEAELALPDLGVKIQLEFSKYRQGLYQVYGPDNQLIARSPGYPEGFDLNLAEHLRLP